MRRRTMPVVSLLLLALSLVGCSFSILGYKMDLKPPAGSSNVLAFIIAILIIAITTWIMRGLVESDPDPFLLNLTFFAFAGQCIRTSELIRDGAFNGLLALLLLFAFLVVLSQVVIMRAHMKTTLMHYKGLLAKYKTESCIESEIDHWADALLQITGVDFSPGLYRWLAIAFAEPREKSRKNAFSILPGSRFQVAPASDFRAESLIVPVSERRPLWYFYLATCLAAWGIFILAMILSTRKT